MDELIELLRQIRDQQSEMVQTLGLIHDALLETNSNLSEVSTDLSSVSTDIQAIGSELDNVVSELTGRTEGSEGWGYNLKDIYKKLDDLA